ncbi:hypothetical protein [Pseudidiomarina terrestris]|uniref:hypothetical protein n=1 Tax=Pseudidiomarina terrestris TaxID=2820060 RepID=UPI0026511205|nr:hypothetical protein [Pseudidiomarina sp. 1ASP75-5]MDN7134436.1 hypothetical protein [Pseudidiomarina sp. 1ASP75-5]
MFSTHRFTLAVAFIVSLVTIPFAQAQIQTYEFSGTLDPNASQGFTQFYISVQIDSTAILVYQDPETQHYENAVGTMNFSLSSPNSGVGAPLNANYSGTVNEVVYSKGVAGDSLQIEAIFDTVFAFPVTARGMIHIEQIEQPFIELSGLFPGVLTGSYSATIEFAREVYERDATEPFSRFAGAGTVTSVVGTLAAFDTDRDGVIDDLDLCSASLVEETVIFGGWLDSGVTNYTDESGCTIMDRYAACEAEEATQPTSPWGWFQPVYSGPTYCEQQVVYGLQDDGIIDYTEGRMLRNALNLSHSSQGPS